MFLALIGKTLWILSSVYTLVLLARVILDWSRFFAPNWRPRGPLLVLANLVYNLTDPPLRWLRQFIPPLRLGAVALDVGFIVLFVAVGIVGRLGQMLVSYAY